jgi:hypothetical protein
MVNSEFSSLPSSGQEDEEPRHGGDEDDQGTEAGNKFF